MNNIHQSLKSMAVDIDSLSPLEGNPRVGNVDAIMASYSEFGQVKPIVARKNEDGTSTVIAGNHQLEAAKALGWDEFELAAIESESIIDEHRAASGIEDGFDAELEQSRKNYEAAASSIKTMIEQDKDGENRIVAPSNLDHNDIELVVLLLRFLVQHLKRLSNTRWCLTTPTNRLFGTSL